MSVRSFSCGSFRGKQNKYAVRRAPLKQNSKPLAIFCDCTARFVSDLVGDPEDQFSHEAQLILLGRCLGYVCLEHVPF